MADMPSRLWRIERLFDYRHPPKWRALSTFTTKERAEQELSWYQRRVGDRRLRIRNRVTGEIVEVADHA